jgi:endonuclease/exonuclease/phosphatase family metal-dependent hydrolase
MKKNFCYCLLISVLTTSFGSAYAIQGSFSTLTYNVAGLPEMLSSAESNRQDATEQISCYVNEFDLVHLQEDFNYHAALYDTCNTHSYRSPTTGGAGFGSGLNSMSHYPYEDWDRVRWNNCNGVDCLTPKGFTLARTELADGVFVDIYNLHTQAQVADADLTARRANLLQLIDYIDIHSVGNAVIIMGDTNTRFTRSGDNIGEFLKRGFTDAWVDLIRDGDVPVAGTAALLCDTKVTDAECEIVDKILYRDNGYLNLKAYYYNVREDAKSAEGLELSDHPPVETRWTFKTDDQWLFSSRIGGPHGTEFNDFSLLPDEPSVRSVTLRAGSRVDQIGLTLTNGYQLSHGGSGGEKQTLIMNDGEYLKSATFCAGKYNGHTRIFYSRIITSQNRSISGGTQTDHCSTYQAASGWSIVGFHGRSGSALDKIGIIYAPANNYMNDVAYRPIVNQASNLCLDISGAQMTDGNNVALWHCSGAAWQQWNYDLRTGLIRSAYDNRFCLTASGSFGNGANLVIEKCVGSSDQRFSFDADGKILLRTVPQQVIDANGMDAGANVTTWSDWGGVNQRWQ